MTEIKNCLDLADLAPADLQDLINLAQAYQDGQAVPALKRPVYAANLFFENSTRTKSSFQMAEKKLGIDLIEVDPKTSSVQKGETLSDTVRTLQAIGVDLTVIRHSQTAWYQDLVENPHIHLGLLNAGDGAGVHPSQTLLDLLTIQKEFGQIKGLKIGIIGDLAHSRVAKSDAKILKQLGAELYFGGPRAWYSNEFDGLGHFGNLEEILPELDVVMMLRVQLERFDDINRESFTTVTYYDQYGLTLDRAKLMKDSAIIMHPAPVNRDVEIASELVDGGKSRIFTQMHNGVYARMAMLTKVLQARGLMEEQK
ncbi:aspartate carbamoyltransferase catalytic subunit [Fructobacillus ficulneus]|uniref:Aspartate carbamoyltransferase n=1 Tax=Fructobacillus ficulneus TaxID=157463 RepID=A0A0K8MIF9_9LACO|nr:aspartate carbamoyltransferase catalytic subunit [Fructobacillus ficulneus]GAO99664.1 aspartate carbamoyltransferase [Fructobacillus ficulneus]